MARCQTAQAGNGALRYEELIRLHIVPRVGNRWLDSLRPLDVQKLYADLEDGGCLQQQC